MDCTRVVSPSHSYRHSYSEPNRHCQAYQDTHPYLHGNGYLHPYPVPPVEPSPQHDRLLHRDDFEDPASGWAVSVGQAYEAYYEGGKLMILTRGGRQAVTAFASDRDGTWSIWVMSADGAGQRKLFMLPGPLDGHVRGETDYASRGWVEERLAWGP